MIKFKEIFEYAQVIGLYALATLATYALNAYIAHHTPTEIYGDYSLGLKTVGLVTPFIIFGSNYTIFKYLSGYIETNNHQLEDEYGLWNRKLITLTLSTFLILYVVGVVVLIVYNSLYTGSLHQNHSAIYFLLLSPLFALNSLLASLLLSRKQYRSAVFGHKILQTGIIIVITYGLVWGLIELTPPILMLAFAIALLISLVFMLSYILKNLPKISAIAENFFHATVDPNVTTLRKSWLKHARIMFGNTMILKGMNTGSLMIIEFMNLNEYDLGYLGAILSISTFLWLIPHALTLILLPITATGWGHTQTYQSQLNRILLTGLPLNLIVAMVLWFLTPTLLSNFGPRYMHLSSWVHLALAFQFICTLTNHLNVILPYGNQEYVHTLKINTIATIAALLITTPVYYTYSLPGVIIANSSMFLLRMLAYAYFVRKDMSIKGLIFI